ncbi:60S ribosomal protein L14 [Anaeramoeba flamelloides]|uniref:60S ribosomal protein L14 n=1 Tax=Anaeramoeba flamelloides TaxID=1746091 RepID=A0ABQ8XJZ8_9EUKA|nr:60S ribosomal protein L14 [Anaeramoeba flamelloides]
MSFFGRFVEAGRIVLITFGKYADKIAVIVDILDQNRVLIDGPSTVNGIPRHVISLKWVSLTNFKIDIKRGAKLDEVEKKFKEEKIEEQWSQTSLAKKLKLKDMRAKMTDFDRFKLGFAKSKRKAILGAEIKRLMKEKK